MLTLYFSHTIRGDQRGSGEINIEKKVLVVFWWINKPRMLFLITKGEGRLRDFARRNLNTAEEEDQAVHQGSLVIRSTNLQ